MLADSAKQRLEEFGNNTKLGRMLADMPGRACTRLPTHACLPLAEIMSVSFHTPGGCLPQLRSEK